MRTMSPRTIVPEPFVLASGSEARRQLLQSEGLSFVVVASGVDERPPSVAEASEPHTYTRALARDKAIAVGERLEAMPDLATPIHSGARRPLVLGCDTCIHLDGIILGKPIDVRHADEFLTLLSGRTHRVITGMYLFDAATGLARETSVESVVQIRRLCCDERHAYLETGEWDGAAGGYRAQGYGARLIERIRGSYSNVVGLPLEALYGILRQTDNLE